MGIVGFPNVGKSTFIRAMFRARPKVGDYPFTTLVPQLGVAALPGERSLVVANVPGLIRGASEGKGLGLDFLRRLERTRVLLHILSPDFAEDRDPLRDLATLKDAELKHYGDMFEGRPAGGGDQQNRHQREPGGVAAAAQGAAGPGHPAVPDLRAHRRGRARS